MQCTHCKSAVDPAARACPCCGAVLLGMPDASVAEPVMNPVVNPVANSVVNPVVNPVMQPQPDVHRRSFLNHCKTLKPWQKLLCVLVPCVFVLVVGIGGYLVATHAFNDTISPDTIKAVYMENADFVANGLTKSKFCKTVRLQNYRPHHCERRKGAATRN